MDNILEQIQSLTDKFNNLFEVEGLGEPSGDVPPSTNKIKKDKKTKDGKVELVSVEDELFPKEGNAKEQFRQKVIDKINGMIQGTATLEDLLQLVRSKQVKPVKEGFEGAIEILEDVLSAIEKKYGSPKYKKTTYEPANKSAELTNKVSNIRNREKLQAAEREVDKDRPDLKVHPAERNDKIVNYYGQIVARRNGRAPLKEAVEILEKLISERKYSEEEIREIAKKVRPERAEKFNKACGELDKVTQGKNPDNFTSVQKYRANKAAEKVERTQDRLNHVDDVINPPVKTPTGIKRANESFEQAVNILEEIINEVSVGKLAQAAENNFEKRRKEHDEAKKGLEKARDSYEEQSKKHPEDEQALYNSLDKLSRVTHKAGEKASHANDIVNLNLPKDSKVSANKLFDKADKTYAKRGKEVDKVLNKGKGRGDKEFDAPMKKYSRAVDLAVADPVVSRRTNGGANESFEQAISQIEGLINCLGESKSAIELSSVAKKVLPQREEEAKKAHASLDNVMHVNPYSMINGKLSQKQRNNIANALNRAERADNKVAKAKSYLEKPKEKQSSGIKFDKILCSHGNETNEGLFVSDGRGDLIDDISKVLTKKTVKQHIVDTAKKIIKKKEK